MAPAMSLEQVVTLLSALAGIVFSLLVMFIVLPKVDNACELPMPKLPSYWLGHAWKFLDIKKLVRTNVTWFKELGDVFQIWIVHRQVVVTANPEDVVHILGKPEVYARPPAQVALFNDLQPDNFQTMPREMHRLHRKLLRDAFSPTTVKGFASTVSRAANALVARMHRAITEQPGSPINFTPEVADTTFTVLLEAVLGSCMGAEKRRKFAQESQALLRELLIEYFTYPLRRVFSFAGVRRKLFRKHRDVLKYADELVAARENETEEERKARPADVLDVIRDLDPTDRKRQVGNTTMFAMAGFESSSEAIAWAIYEICRHPDVRSKVVKEVDIALRGTDELHYDDIQGMTYLKAVWRETLRLHPAAGFMLRVTTRDTVLPGSRVHVPKGVQVGVLIAGAQRHPRYVCDPEAYRPERWMPGSQNRVPSAAFVPFSCGPERCPGQALADYEGVAILAALFRDFDITLACDPRHVVPISDWTERARAPAPGAKCGDASWTVPVHLTRRR